jgi:hypothetical protein
METPQETAQTKPTKPVHTTRKHYFITAGLVLVAVVVTAFIYNSQLTSLRAQLTSSGAANKVLSEDKAELTAKNKKLSAAAKAQQEGVSEVDDSSQNAASSETEVKTDKPAAKPVTVTTAAGELTVVRLKKTSITEFANPTENPMPSGDVLALYVIIKNTSGGTQHYNTHDFTAVTDNGEAIKSRLYAPSAQKAWYGNDLVNGGSKEVALLYGTDINIVSLEWTAPGGTDTVTVPVPAVEE